MVIFVFITYSANCIIFGEGAGVAERALIWGARPEWHRVGSRTEGSSQAFALGPTLRPPEEQQLLEPGDLWVCGSVSKAPWPRPREAVGAASGNSSRFLLLPVPRAGLIGFLFMLRALVAANFNTIYIYTAEVSSGEGAGYHAEGRAR